jgi:hypothetical protein
MFNWINNLTKNKKVEPIAEPPKVEEPVKKPRKPRNKKPTNASTTTTTGRRKEKKTPVVDSPKLTEKDIATANKEPWVAVTHVEFDPNDLGVGSFVLDWNDYFIAKLVKAGFRGTDVDMVDQWFQSICRSILQEDYEQAMADPDKREN